MSSSLERGIDQDRVISLTADCRQTAVAAADTEITEKPELSSLLSPLSHSLFPSIPLSSIYCHRLSHTTAEAHDCSFYSKHLNRQLRRTFSSHSRTTLITTTATTKMTLIEKFHFDQKVFISDRPSCLRKAKDDDDDDTNCSDSDTHSGSSDVHTVNSDAHSHLSSTDDQITFGLNLQHNEEKECILIRLATLKSQPDSVYVNFDLKFTFLNALEEEGPFSFSKCFSSIFSFES